MRKSLVALLLVVGAAAFAANFAFASGDDAFTGSKLMNAGMAKELQTRAARLGTSILPDTVYVGFSKGHSTANNYWSVYAGNDQFASPANFNRPQSDGFGSGAGLWDFEPHGNNYLDVHGDSLQGWWSTRLQFFFGGGLTIPDYTRPWNCLDFGNSVSYVFGANKRTFGVVSAWHVDGGNTVSVPASVNWSTDPVANKGGVTWAPLAGNSSAWMGLRRHGDTSYQDPITKNYYNEDADLPNGSVANTVSANGSDAKFPGYVPQMDQMLYRDIDVSGAGDTSITVSFSYRTAMSTNFGKNNASRRGWFQHDPLAVITGVPNANFISNQFDDNVDGPADSFMVYVGAPAEGSVLLSDGNTHTIFDPLRRWFGEVLRSNEGLFKEILSVAGTGSATPPSVTIPKSLINAWKAANAGNPAAANKIRVVFRVKTNNLYDDETTNANGYSSGGVGAAIVDAVSITTPGGTHNVSSGFESAGEIDNTLATTAAWHGTGKPPATYYHIRQLNPSTGLVYQDLCGPPLAGSRTCNMLGQIVSMGNKDDNEAAEGVHGTAEQDQHKGMYSPTINLSDAGGVNNMGLDGTNVEKDANATDDYYLDYEIYTGVFDVTNQGNFWRFGTRSYPGGVATTGENKRWGQTQFFQFVLFNPDKQCFRDIEPLKNTIRTTNLSGIPDSIQVFLGSLSECFRFGVANSEQLGGGYFDNIAFDIVDTEGSTGTPISLDIWQPYQDSFPSNDSPGFAGVATAFDTTTALMKSGLNIAQSPGNVNRFDVPGDTTMVTASGDSVRMDLVFRILPGPGNYVNPAIGANSQLKKLPTSATPVAAAPVVTSNNFWESYLAYNGDKGTPGGHPNGTGSLAGQKVWNPNVWNSARMDTAEINRFNVQGRTIIEPGDATLWMTAYHETELSGSYTDKFYPSGNSHARTGLGIPRNICFLADTAGATSAILCGSGNTGGANYPPDWITTLPHSTTGWNGTTTTTEGTKIIPDGVLTPGSHVEYFFRRQDGPGAGDPVAIGPDTTVVTPQNSEGPNIDGHRWQEFSVLPDRWKSGSYTNPVIGTPGRGQACLLYIDANDRRGDERTWIGLADSIGATRQEKWGAHNGWYASGANGVDVNANDGVNSFFVSKHIGQAGTTFDMYQIKASESIDSPAGRIGSRGKGWYSYTDITNTQIDGKTSRQGPTLDMLNAYYRLMMFLSGDLNSAGLLGQYLNVSANDYKIIEDWLKGGSTASATRGFFAEGNGFVEATDDGGGDGTTFLTTYLGVQLRSPDYRQLSANNNQEADIIPTSEITSRGDIYGVHSTCAFTLDVLDRSGALSGNSAVATFYDPAGSGGAPFISGVIKHFDGSTGGTPWVSLVDGWDIRDMHSGDGEYSSRGRLAYIFNVFSNVFATVCQVNGAAAITLDTPNNHDGRLFNFMSLANNPLRSGSATVNLGLAKAERVKVQIFDVSGRLVRTLADRSFTAGEHKLTWDGTANDGHLASRGVYFVRSQHADSKFTAHQNLIVLK